MNNVSSIDPIYSKIVGVELVTIPVSYYEELLEYQRMVQSGGLSAARGRAHTALIAVDPRSRLFGDPDVCVFLFEAFGRTKLKDVVVACQQRFGVERCPSRATIARYWARLR